jgi:DNA-binding LacI/PurR family transcriptional regulator
MRPDGVFCVTDLIACGFIDAARHEFGLKIPQDIMSFLMISSRPVGWAIS